MTTPLADILRARIAESGPLPVSDWMSACLYDPDHGYYMTGTPVGAKGAFITAPEVSQMFGELLGLWAAAHWQAAGGQAAGGQAAGATAPVRLVELGPGRGTLMVDALRAIGQALPDLAAVLTVHLVETSPVLRDMQARALQGQPVTWHDDMGDIPDGFTLLLANEFFDALPVQQYVQAGARLEERCVEVDADGGFAFTTSATPEGHRGIGTPALADAATRATILESCPAANGWAAAIGARLRDHGGAALIIDYGQEQAWQGSTLQAVRDHQRADPLEAPGKADLTAHVFFGEIRNVAEMEGARGWPLLTQGELLTRLGIQARRAALSRGAEPAQAADIDSAVTRLVSPDQMGTLFKALALTGPDDPAPPGFS